MAIGLRASTVITLPSGRMIEAVLVARKGMRRMSLKVDPVKRHVVISAPPRAAKRDALSFAVSNAAWIEARFDALPASAPFAEGGLILFRGRQTRLLRRDGRGAPLYQDGPEPSLSIAASPDRLASRTIAALKTLAQAEAIDCVDRLTPKLGKAPSAIALRDTKSRWGSCTSGGQIMLSWRLIAAPPKVFEYVVAHEMAHLKEMNHSPRFWAHVEALVPDWKPARAWLKANGTKLHALGA